MLPPEPAARMAWICARWHRNTLVSVDVDHALPSLHGIITTAGSRPTDARIVDRDMHTAQFLHRALHRRFDGRIIGHVQRDADRLHAAALQLRHRGINCLLLQVPYRNTRTGCGKGLRDRQTDAGYTAGHDRGLAGELVINHLCSPSVGDRCGLSPLTPDATPPPVMAQQTACPQAIVPSIKPQPKLMYGIAYGYAGKTPPYVLRSIQLGRIDQWF